MITRVPPINQEQKKVRRLAPEETFGSSVALYDSLAQVYDSLFDAPGHRNIYDTLAWEHVSRFISTTPAFIIDVGCGTGRWAAKWLAAGHRVIGIEQAPSMIEVLRSKNLGPQFELVASAMEDAVIESGCADLVVAMGSAHYARNPALMLVKFAQWVKPGGMVCVYVDSLVALVLELLRLQKLSEAFACLERGRGVWQQGGHRAHLHLFDRKTLEALFAKAGLHAISSRGLLVTASAWGREGFSKAIADDAQAFLDLERQLSEFGELADAGKHLLVSGRRPL
ncbi:MAG: methyltransferase domain-containing protein [Deltaproteobacteria bacterium]|nr:methyltransferase domain-containing protein [Deltaproteobacteria bacterium]